MVYQFAKGASANFRQGPRESQSSPRKKAWSDFRVGSRDDADQA